MQADADMWTCIWHNSLTSRRVSPSTSRGSPSGVHDCISHILLHCQFLFALRSAHAHFQNSCLSVLIEVLFWRHFSMARRAMKVATPQERRTAQRVRTGCILSVFLFQMVFGLASHGHATMGEHRQEAPESRTECGSGVLRLKTPSFLFETFCFSHMRQLGVRGRCCGPRETRRINCQESSPHAWRGSICNPPLSNQRRGCPIHGKEDYSTRGLGFGRGPQRCAGFGCFYCLPGCCTCSTCCDRLFVQDPKRPVIFYTNTFCIDPDGTHISYKINHDADNPNLEGRVQRTSNKEWAIILRAKRVLRVFVSCDRS